MLSFLLAVPVAMWLLGAGAVYFVSRDKSVLTAVGWPIAVVRWWLGRA